VEGRGGKGRGFINGFGRGGKKGGKCGYQKNGVDKNLKQNRGGNLGQGRNLAGVNGGKKRVY